MQLKVSATAFRSLFLSFSILLSFCPAFAEGNNDGKDKEAAQLAAAASRGKSRRSKGRFSGQCENRP
jgi:hypothetical protein